MRKAWVVVACLLAFTDARGAPVGSVAKIDRTIAHVGDAVIWESDVTARMLGGRSAREVLDEMIDDELVIAEGHKANITVDASEVKMALDEIKQQNNLDDAGLAKALADAGYTRLRYERELERQLMILRTKNQILLPQIDVTDAEIEAEAKSRNMTMPLSDDDKGAVRRELVRKAFDGHAVKWIAGLRKRTWIQRQSIERRS